MAVTDAVGDMLTRLRNANMVHSDSLEVPSSKMKLQLSRILKKEGFIRDYRYIEDGKQGKIRIYLKYGSNKERVISGLKRISKPGLRVYAGKDELPRVLGGLGVAVISTPKGVLSDKEARTSGVGGEVICYVW